MTTTSGHTIHLMPGDHTYDTPNIPVVVVWNGINHYSPTYPTSPENVMKWKLTLVNKHLSEAIGIFGEVEGELDDSEDMELCEQFHSLRDTAVRAQELLKGSSIGQVVIPPSQMGPDPRDVVTSLTRSTNLAQHPLPAVRGEMSRTLESIVDVADAANYKKPLIPVDPPLTTAESTPVTTASIDVTSLTQCHKHPIPSTSSKRTFFPNFPQEKPTSAEFSFPVGTFMEVKRNLGGKDIPPAPKTGTIPEKTSDSQRESKSGKGGPAKSSSSNVEIEVISKPSKSAKPGRAAPITKTGAIPGKTGKTSDSRGDKEGRKRDKPELIVSITLPPPQVPPPVPQQALSAASVLAAAAVSSVTSGQSSSGSRPKTKLQLIKCLECKYSTFNRGDFNLHMDKHRGVRYICPEEGCPKDFGSVKARENHFRTFHLKKHRSECPFPDCNFSHNDHGVTKVHLYTDHGVGVEPKCRHPDCAGRDLFTNFRVFERHMQTFHKPKDAQCPHCKKKYKGVGHLKVHISTSHKKEKTFQCDQCGKFYASEKTLKAHKEEHHKC